MVYADDLCTIPLAPLVPFVPCSNFAAGGKEDHLWQPCSRRDYNKYIEGVDTADPLNGYYSTLHKAKNYLWRGVFEQKLMQAWTNAWLLFRWWLQAIVARANVEVELLGSRSVAPGDGTAEGALLAGLKAELRDLQALRRRNRAQWMQALSAHLMKQCAEGKRGGRRKRRAPVPLFQPRTDRLQHLRRISTAQYCYAPGCRGSYAPKAQQQQQQQQERRG